MNRSDYAEPILKARAALQTAERLLMDGKPNDAERAAIELRFWADELMTVCSSMSLDMGQRIRYARQRIRELAQ